MKSALTWVSKEYDDGNKEFISQVMHLHFENCDKELTIGYVIAEEYQKIFSLYFECNESMFQIGQYEAFEAAHEEAQNHYSQFILK